MQYAHGRSHDTTEIHHRVAEVSNESWQETMYFPRMVEQTSVIVPHTRQMVFPLYCVETISLSP